MFVCVALTRGRVITSYLPTATTVEQPRALYTLTEVTPNLLFEILNPLKLKLGKKKSGKIYGNGKRHNHLIQEAKGVRTEYSEWDVLLCKRA
jgi:hypothetical protein